MELIKELLSSDVGILSAVTITVTCVIITYCISFFIRKTREDQAED